MTTLRAALQTSRSAALEHDGYVVVVSRYDMSDDEGQPLFKLVVATIGPTGATVTLHTLETPERHRVVFTAIEEIEAALAAGVRLRADRRIMAVQVPAGNPYWQPFAAFPATPDEGEDTQP
jgi:hypothetical protein